MSQYKLTGTGEFEIDDGAYNRKFKAGESFALNDDELARIKRLGLANHFAESTPNTTPNTAPTAPRKSAVRTEKDGE